MRSTFATRLSAVRCQGGVALAIVVWFIAGMSLLVAGIVSHARVDTRMAQLHVSGAKAAAAGDGAIQLMMAGLVTGTLPVPREGELPGANFRLGELGVEVTLVPATGLLDINNTQAPLLAGLFRVAGGLGAAEAKIVADNVVKWRHPGSGQGARGGVRRFTAIEDLLRVEGVTRRLLDSARNYIVAGDASRRGTDWSQVPTAVMDILRETDPQRASNLLQHRAGTKTGRKTREAPIARDGMYRADATVRYGDQLWLRRRWVKMEAQGTSRLPWHTHRTEAPRVVGKAI